MDNLVLLTYHHCKTVNYFCVKVFFYLVKSLKRFLFSSRFVTPALHIHPSYLTRLLFDSVLEFKGLGSILFVPIFIVSVVVVEDESEQSKS